MCSSSVLILLFSLYTDVLILILCFWYLEVFIFHVCTIFWNISRDIQHVSFKAFFCFFLLALFPHAFILLFIHVFYGIKCSEGFVNFWSFIFVFENPSLLLWRFRPWYKAQFLWFWGMGWVCSRGIRLELNVSRLAASPFLLIFQLFETWSCLLAQTPHHLL